MKTIQLDDQEASLIKTLLEQTANHLFQKRVEEAKKGKNKDENYSKQLLEQYNRIDQLIQKLS